LRLVERALGQHGTHGAAIVAPQHAAANVGRRSTGLGRSEALQAKVVEKAVLAHRLARVVNCGVVGVTQFTQHDAKLIGTVLAKLHVVANVAVVAKHHCVGEARRNADNTLGQHLERCDALCRHRTLVLGARDRKRADRNVQSARQHTDGVLRVNVLLAQHKRQKALIAHWPCIAVGTQRAAGIAPIAATHTGAEHRRVGTDPSDRDASGRIQRTTNDRQAQSLDHQMQRGARLFALGERGGEVKRDRLVDGGNECLESHNVVIRESQGAPIVIGRHIFDRQGRTRGHRGAISELHGHTSGTIDFVDDKIRKQMLQNAVKSHTRRTRIAILDDAKLSLAVAVINNIVNSIIVIVIVVIVVVIDNGIIGDVVSGSDVCTFFGCR
jgi:hypothetical protein